MERLNSDDIDLYAATAAFALDLAGEQEMQRYSRCHVWSQGPTAATKIVYISTACATPNKLAADFSARMGYTDACKAILTASPRTTIVILPVFHQAED